MTTDSKPDYRKRIFEIATIFIPAFVFVGQYSVIKSAEAYYGHFGLTLSDINFVPEIYDYVNILPLTLISSVIVVLLVAGLIRFSIWIGDLLSRKTKPSKKFVKFVKRYRTAFGRLVKILEWILKVGAWSIVAWVFVWSVTYFSLLAGESSAQSKKSFQSISKKSDSIQKLIIYADDGRIVLKSYDTSNHKFIDGYETMNGENYSTRIVHL